MVWMGTKTFSTTDKYNSGELNRVNANISYLSTAIAALGIAPILPYAVNTSYNRLGFPHVSDLKYTRANLKALVDGFYKSYSAPAIVVDSSRVQAFSFAEANVLENNEQCLYNILQTPTSYFPFSGRNYSGQDRTYL